jgi:hypothetical protein
VRVLLTALAIPAFSLGLAIGAAELMKEPVVPEGQPNSIVWADRVYENRHDLAKWLRAHGSTYRSWAKDHPASAAVLSGHLHQSDRPEAVRARRVSATEPRKGSRDSTTAITLVAASAAGILAFGAVQRTRSRIPRRRRRRKPERGDRRRTSVSVATLSRTARARLGARLSSRRGQLGHSLGRIDVRRRSERFVLVSKSVFQRAAAWLGSLRGQLGHSVARIDLHRARNWFGSRRARHERSFDRMDVYQGPRLRAPEAIRQRAPDIAFAAMSILFAVAVGASLALYLH